MATCRGRQKCPSPSAPVEEGLTGIWSEVLGLDQVGIHDNFMELGGHSLLATRVVSRAISTFRIDVPLRTIFEAPTVAEMALVIAQHQAKNAEPDRIERLMSELEALSDQQVKQARGDDVPEVEPGWQTWTNRANDRDT